MKESIYSVGLDIGNSKICAVAGKKDADGAISILHYAEKQYDRDYESMVKGFSKNSQNLNQTASFVLQELANNSSLDIGSVNCNYSNEFISLKGAREEYTNGGDKFIVNNHTLEQLVRNAKDNFRKKNKSECLHPLPTDFYIDELKINKYPEGATGNKLTCNFNFVTSPKDKLQAHYDATSNLQYGFMDNKKTSFPVSVDQMVYSPIADATSVLSIEDKQNGILLINLGAQLTEITVFKDFGMRHTHVLGIGSQAILKDLVQAFNITELRAEAVLRASCDKPSKETEINEVLELEGRDGLPTRQLLLKSVAIVIESRLKEIVGLIASNVIQSDYARVLGNGVIVSGAIARLELVKQIFEKTFSPLTVRMADSTRNVDYNSYLELSHPKYSTAIGLMLSALKPVDDRMPLANVFKEKRKLPLSFFKNNPISNLLGRLDDPELRQTYS
jgi:cell division protein FtsA